MAKFLIWLSDRILGMAMNPGLNPQIIYGDDHVEPKAHSCIHIYLQT